LPGAISPAFSPVHLADFTAENVMDKDRVAGSAKEIKGAVKEAVGKVVGDAKLESEGKVDRAKGKVQNAIGGLKDVVRDAVEK
jgi:uncharacterized protein YjbJ (UPF0337 family)